ncbi:MAG: family 16 glycoside hydrolase [Limisphaerales bacterium]
MKPVHRTLLFLALPLITSAGTSVGAATSPVFDWAQHDWNRPRPAIIEPATPSTQERPGKPPSDAVVLFDGSSVSPWVSMNGSAPKWVVKDGSLECVRGSGYIRTLQAFGDCQLHVEWAAPTPPEGTSQGRGNSGVFLMGLYEVQVLDSHGNITYADGQAAAAYGQHPPLVNASLPPGQWQTYDILFTRPRFNEQGEVTSPARLTVLHNGVLVQNNVELVGPTGWLRRQPYKAHPDKLPISLQDHGNPVRYRNIWVRELGADARHPEFVYGNAVLERLLGTYRVDDGLSIAITRKGGLLVATLGNPEQGMRFDLHAESPTVFHTHTFDGRFTFQTDAAGTADSLVFRIGGEDRRGTKTH